jgi:hypothetical protein
MKPSIILAVVGFLASTSTFPIKASVPKITADVGTARAGAQPRPGASSVLLYDGRILITGGVAGSGVSNSAERYSPTIEGFLQTPPMHAARAGHSATLLPDGCVLVAGGMGADGRALAAAEIYNPAWNVWTPAPPMHRSRTGHTARVLSDGKVLIAGGDANGDSIEMFSPDDGVFVPFRP